LDRYVLSKKIDYKKMFQLAAKKLSKRLKLSETEIYNLLMEKEARFSSVLTDNVAIAHIVFPGENIFDIMLVRGKEGIVFKDGKEPKIIFILIGSLDMRNFHLKSLAAIAQIVHNKNFNADWLNAKNSEVLKEVVLMSRRERFKD